MTPWTRKMLEDMGWKEGDPIPGDIGRKLQSAIQSVQQQGPAHPMGKAPPAGSRVKIGATVNFEDLPPEKQQELREAMAAARDAGVNSSMSLQSRAEAALPSTLAPGVREAAIKAKMLELQRQDAQAAPEGPQVVFTRTGPDFRKQVTPAAATPVPVAATADVDPNTPVYSAPPVLDPQQVVDRMPPTLQPRTGAVVAGASGLAAFVTNDIPRPAPSVPEGLPEEAPQPPADTTVAEPDDAGGTLPMTRCPRCLWNMAHSFEAQPTADDRLSFVATVLGTARFKKIYVLLGGRLRVTFRSLTSAEVDLVFRQMRIDQLRGLILGEADYFGRLNMYRLACMVEQIADGEGAIISDVPEIFDIPYDEPEFGQPDQTRLVPMVEWFNDNICKTESMRRMVAQKHREFQRLLEALEAQTSTPDFWTEIG